MSVGTNTFFCKLPFKSFEWVYIHWIGPTFAFKAAFMRRRVRCSYTAVSAHFTVRCSCFCRFSTFFSPHLTCFHIPELFYGIDQMTEATGDYQQRFGCLLHLGYLLLLGSFSPSSCSVWMLSPTQYSLLRCHKSMNGFCCGFTNFNEFWE